MSDRELTEVRIVRVDMSFMDMVTLLIKFAFAVIPAALIVAAIWAAIFGFAGGMLSN